MRGYFGLGQLSPSEKSDILDQHKQIYDGYKTMLPQVSNTQPLYTQDYANDKNGITVNNKGVVKRYTNVGINEQVEESKEVCDECGAMGMSEEKEMCSECGGMMQEGECSECGWKGEVGAMEEETGHLDDIYNEVDLDPNAEFDYVKGASNKTNAFHVREQSEDYINYDDNMDDGDDVSAFNTDGDFLGTFGKNGDMETSDFEDPDNEDDGFEDINASEVTDEIEEQGYTGGGNAPDMDLSNIDPAYDFISDGPMAGGDVYPTEGEVDEEWEQMESAWSEEIDEIDVSGAQGIYGDMEPAFDFDSGGPGKAGPYQRSSWSEGSVDDKKIEHGYEGEDEDAYWEKDLADDELDLDLTKFNPEDKSWEEISAYTGDDEFSYLDEDIRESVINQKNKIMEMMNRMKVIK
jgi:hypothetical protein